MKAIYLLLLMAAMITKPMQSPEEVRQHHGYKTYFNPNKREPDSVSWNVTASMFACGDVSRLPFAADPSISDCPGDGAYDQPLNGIKYSQGHMFNFDEAKCDPDNRKECFYMSNMLPQVQNFN